LANSQNQIVGASRSDSWQGNNRGGIGGHRCDGHVLEQGRSDRASPRFACERGLGSGRSSPVSIGGCCSSSRFVFSAACHACGRSCATLSSSSVSVCTIPCAKPGNGSSQSCRATPTTMRYLGISIVSAYSGIGSLGSGGVHFAAVARNTRSHGHVFSPWLTDGSRDRECSILTLQFASPPVIRDKNRMR
jgi:hypothetical protein